jgi:hypothetical protein
MGKQPDYRASAPVESEGGKFWVSLGAAWKGRDGKITLRLNALPLQTPDGHCTIMLFENNDESNAKDDGLFKGNLNKNIGRGYGATAFDIDLDEDVPF